MGKVWVMAETQSDALENRLQRTFLWTACINTITTGNKNKNIARMKLYRDIQTARVRASVTFRAFGYKWSDGSEDMMNETINTGV
jgi:hypothetical protein